MMYFGLMYVLMLLLAFPLQKIVLRNREKPENPGKPWGKFVVFALIVPLVGLVYVTNNHNARFLFHLFVALASLFEIGKHVVLQKKVSLPSLAFFLVFILVGFNFVWISREQSVASSALLSVYFTVVIFDSYSQLTGQLFGKVRIFPKISPNKTYEGLAGGALASFASSCILGLLSDSYMLKWWQIPIVILLAFLGDTMASGSKRSLGIKDFSNALPFQGGFLDRFDSYLFASLCFPIFSLLP